MSSLREKRYYPVLFMLILTIVLTAILAFSYEVSKERVKAYKELSFKQELLGLFRDNSAGLKSYELEELELAKINELYNQYISEQSLSGEESRKYYEFREDGILKGKCYPVSFGGLWGAISMLVAVDQDFREIIGVRITEQNETPGLGGRILEDWFQEQFSGKEFLRGKEFQYWKIVSEDSDAGDMEMRQVSGATVSSRAVRDGLLGQLKQINDLRGAE